ncbi:hypothetical protein PHJA_001305700 [Phtheirospermum japonicum]|uniref:Uncharacterized protein n=1 Tax=Phtheirospermum japonicum TaxID=374723 RepID=A0A830BUG7_9LAMI|nr:hypothetical protein PHJA_001305700 [Phtheirospermum japonicum]
MAPASPLTAPSNSPPDSPRSSSPLPPSIGAYGQLGNRGGGKGDAWFGAGRLTFWRSS